MQVVEVVEGNNNADQKKCLRYTLYSTSRRRAEADRFLARYAGFAVEVLSISLGGEYGTAAIQRTVLAAT